MTDKDIQTATLRLYEAIAARLSGRLNTPVFAADVREALRDALGEEVGTPGFVIVWNETDGLKMNFGRIK